MTSSESTGSALIALSDALAAAVATAAAATVTVNARRRFPATGVIVQSGVVVTADHVIEREEEITVGLADGRTIAAKLAGRDPSTDLAVLRVESAGAPATAAAAPRTGNIVLALGRPSTGGPIASFGIVSAVGGPLRTRRGGQLGSTIRSDVTLYPGFSGGPLVAASGAVAGINTSALSRSLAFTVPYADVQRVVATLLAHGKVRHGFLGVSSQPVKLPETVAGKLAGQTSGLLIIGTEPGGPADAGGVLLGDILVGMAGEALTDTDDLQRQLGGDRIGQATPVRLVRGGELRECTVTIGERA